MSKYIPAVRAFLNVTRALSDPTRVRALLALQGRELCVCQLTALFKLAPSTMSKHLSVLDQAGLVAQRKQGRWIFYRLPGRDSTVSVRKALDWVVKSLAGDPRAADDAKRLSQVLKCDPAALCRRQCRS